MTPNAALYGHYTHHLANDTFLSWLALTNGQAVATSGISIAEKPPYPGCASGKIALVSGMYTLPEYRRHGIARDLLCRVMDDARAKGCGMAHITASRAGVPLYQSVGFCHNERFLQIAL